MSIKFDEFVMMERFVESQRKKAINQESSTKKEPSQSSRILRRRYCFTSYQSLEKESYHVLESHPHIKYYVIGLETCPTTQRKHIQGYVSFKDRVDFNTLKKLLPDSTTHIEVCKGTEQQNITYCKKEGNYSEYGTPTESGKRTDLITAYQNSLTLKDFIAVYPDIYTRYRAGVEGYYRYKGEDYIINDYKPIVIWLYGDTGTGKTRIVKDYIKQKYYEGYRTWRRPLGSDAWFDGYANQDIVFLDEVRGSTYKFDDLLQMLDYDAPKVPIKGGFTEFRPKIILITSNTSPLECYSYINEENKQQLVRRCNYIKKIKSYKENYLSTLE